ncbi:hypothetical protein [Inediibacterium massiliense]|uniref:hypothetical protein n=1 Tax=Inediibacterium massiliense TaxID=1658111 RepID=UPI0018FE91BF|nr:hypothetical protein [Inediibacterium massiliense]
MKASVQRRGCKPEGMYGVPTISLASPKEIFSADSDTSLDKDTFKEKICLWL